MFVLYTSFIFLFFHAHYLSEALLNNANCINISYNCDHCLKRAVSENECK